MSILGDGPTNCNTALGAPIEDHEIRALVSRLRGVRKAYRELALAGDAIDAIWKFRRFPVPDVDPGHDQGEIASVESFVPWVLGVVFGDADATEIAGHAVAGGSACAARDFVAWFREGANREPPPIDATYRAELNVRDALRDAGSRARQLTAPLHTLLVQRDQRRLSPEAYAVALQRAEIIDVAHERCERYWQIARYGYGPAGEAAYRAERAAEYQANGLEPDRSDLPRPERRAERAWR